MGSTRRIVTYPKRRFSEEELFAALMSAKRGVTPQENQCGCPRTEELWAASCRQAAAQKTPQRDLDLAA